MNRQENNQIKLDSTIENISQAISVVNKHAKTAINPKFLYKLKQVSMQKLLDEGKAKKIGLHFSKHPRNSQQQSDILVECGSFTFHMPPTKQDFQTLPHLGSLDNNVRNPKSSLSLNQAKKLLIQYTGLKEEQLPNKPLNKKYEKPVFKKLGESY